MKNYFFDTSHHALVIYSTFLFLRSLLWFRVNTFMCKTFCTLIFI